MSMSGMWFTIVFMQESTVRSFQELKTLKNAKFLTSSGRNVLSQSSQDASDGAYPELA